MIPIATKVCLFSDKTNFHWKIIRPVEVDLFGAVRFAIGGKKELLKHYCPVKAGKSVFEIVET